jgi:hypothetical protein
MPSLPELQRDFVAAAVFGDAAALHNLGIISRGLDPAARIGIYRNNVFGNYRKALGATYPVVQRLVGTPFFNAAVDAFVRAYPSRHGDVNRYGGELARFLVAYPPARELRYLPDVARLEWAIDQAGIAADAPPLDLHALAAVPEDRRGELRFSLHPSAFLIVSRYPIYRIWQVNQPDFHGDPAVDLTAGGDTLLVMRGAQGTTIERLAAGEHALLSGLARGVNLGEAAKLAASAETAFDLTHHLRHHVAAHTIVSFRLPAPVNMGTTR